MGEKKYFVYIMTNMVNCDPDWLDLTLEAEE